MKRVMKIEKHILIAEDDAQDRRFLKNVFSKEGYKVQVARDGLEAWQLFQMEKPSVVITDIKMPDTDGLELLKRIREKNETVPVIILSGVGTVDNLIKTLRLGAWDFIPKPIDDLDQLIQVVEKALYKSGLMVMAKLNQEQLLKMVDEKTQELKREGEALHNSLKRQKIIERLLEHAKQEWERTADALSEILGLVDKDYRIVRCNKTMAKAMGLRVQEAVGECCYERIHKTDSPPDYCPHRLLMKDGKARIVEAYDENRKCYLEINAVPFKDKDGTVVGAVCITRDITKRKEAEKERDILNAQLLQAQKLEAVGQLAAGIAHEINTPTQYIGSNIDFFSDCFEDMRSMMDAFLPLLEEAKKTGLFPELVNRAEKAMEDADWEYIEEEVISALSQAKEGIGKVTKIVRAMKEFSHPGSKDMKEADINRIIETIATISKNEWKYVSDLVTRLDPGLPPVQCLADELGQVILNMVVNAAHSIEERLGGNPESEKGLITVTTSMDEGLARVDISDTGAGIPKQIIDRIFDPFFTTKEVGKGSGQGLAIARNLIVEKHGGSIDVRTKVGEGTTFTIKIPAGKR